MLFFLTKKGGLNYERQELHIKVCNRIEFSDKISGVSLRWRQTCVEKDDTEDDMEILVTHMYTDKETPALGNYVNFF